MTTVSEAAEEGDCSTAVSVVLGFNPISDATEKTENILAFDSGYVATDAFVL